MTNFSESLRGARIFDLAQPLYAGVPHFPTHAPFLFTLNKLHGEFQLPNGGSSALETITMGAHTGTHIDSLNHFSCCGKVHGGVEPVQSPTGGITPHSIDTVEPIFRRAVLFDIARQQGVDALPADFEVTPAHLDAAGLTLGRGDIGVIRTGWSRYWNDPKQFVTAGTGVNVTSPGVTRAGAEWFSSRGVFAAGSDTLAFERMPSPLMEVHLHLLVDSGIHIIENLNLETIAEAGVKEFIFAAGPLKIRGGTGSPLRPFGVAL